MGSENQQAELNAEADFSYAEFPIPTKTDGLSAWRLRSQVAEDNRQSSFDHSRKRMEEAGIPQAALDRFLSNFCQAVWLYKPDPASIELDPNKNADDDFGHEKICLEQIRRLYSISHRAHALACFGL